MKNIIKKENSQPATFGSVVNQIFQSNLSKFFNDEPWGFDGLQARSQVPVNVREVENSYEIEVIAPGLKKQDFRLDLVGNLLTISFDQKEASDEGSATAWLRKEFQLPSFSRSFTVDDTVDVTNVTARYENGILHIALPKREIAQALSRTISIQ
jgi:HSP20 family protein